MLNNLPTKRSKMQSIFLLLSIAFGISIVMLFVVQEWITVAAFIGATIIILILFLFKNKPEFIIVVCLILQFIPIGRYIGFPLYLALFIYLVIERWSKKGNVISFNIINVSWLALIILGCITIPKWNNYFSGMQWFMSLVIIPFIIYILIIDEYIKPDAIRWLLATGIPIIIGFIVIATFILSAIIIINQSSNITTYNFLIAFRGIVITGNGHNRLAGFLIFCAVYGYLTREFWSDRKLKKITFSVILYTALALSLLFVSRGALISLCTAIIIYFIGKYFMQEKVRHKKELRLLPIVLGILAAVFILITTKPFIEFLILRMQDYKNYSTLSRLVMWENCLLKIKSGIIMGTGPGQYPWYGIGELLEDPHNILLRYGVEFGAISLIFVAVVLFYPFLLVAKKVRGAREETVKTFLLFAPPLLGVFVHSMVDSLIGSRGMGPFIWLIWAIFIKYLLGFSNKQAA